MDRRYGIIAHTEADPNKYGIPSQKKYPMPDAKHVRSAIKFFNYVDPAHEKELADAILLRMQEYGMDIADLSVGDDNRFSKYMPNGDELTHWGIRGMKWGIRRYQNPDGTLTEAGKKRYGSDTDDSEAKARAAEMAKIRRLKTTHPSLLTDDELNYLQERRKAERRAVDYSKQYKKLKKKKAEKLTDAELQYLLQRKDAERNLKKSDSFVGSLLRESLIDVAKPALVAAGKSWLVSKYSKDTFKQIMDVQVSRAFGYQNTYSGKKKSGDSDKKDS